MRKLLVIAMVMISAGAWGQQTTGCFSTDGVHCDMTQPAPLKCGKYQHMEGMCHLVNGMVECPTVPGNGYCVDDLHTVTEREWKELMARLKKLEKESVKRSDVTAVYGSEKK